MTRQQVIKACWILSRIGFKAINEAHQAAKSVLVLNMDTRPKISYTYFREVINK